MKSFGIAVIFLSFVVASYAAVVSEMASNEFLRGGYSSSSSSSSSKECCMTTCQYAELCPISQPTYSQAPTYAQPPSYSQPPSYGQSSSSYGSSSYRLLNAEENQLVNRGGYAPTSQCILVPIECCTDCKQCYAAWSS
ncbi:hypothetical protein Gasu2_16590 [Galdieria sulphuraria]|uniref:Uncharacterized protein n=1 Tax=Galdieria sulphuraria TaxID=130081 RepID=M2WW21_GALSU|nr:uncharacterized protein Gasu_43600 [Galdieria sulphuraria]EME28195.1 hypothetical protein Gasu_43600 [Galdieria sulphuraria]GJD07292.1 hypothetical protein Gasu2_16590 [Galdieria sulphuraria]|eukprot:XP_005704715.1 hypothetical protein Gasu_43600 [Galdieria sulphuraria]